VPIYDRYLAARLQASDADLPETVALVITERDLLESGAYDTLEQFLDLAFQFGTEKVVVYVSVLDEGPSRRSAGNSNASGRPARWPSAALTTTSKSTRRSRFPSASAANTSSPRRSRASPKRPKPATSTRRTSTRDDVDRRLVFPTAPDLVIKTGAERLSDFMIWQSVYSELYFTDVNWRNFRERDYLRVAGLPGQTAQVWALELSVGFVGG